MGERSSLAFTVIKLLRAAVQRRAAPAVVTFENVPGLLSKPAEFKVLVQALQGCGYRAGAVMMDSDSWLPASRKRVFLVGVRKDVDIPAACIGDGPHPRWSTPALLRAHTSLGAEAQRAWVWWSMPPAETCRPELSSLLETEGEAVQWLGATATGRFLHKLDRPGRAELDCAMAAGRPVWGFTMEKMDSSPAMAAGKRDRVSVFRREVAFTLLASTTGSSRQRLVHVDGTCVRLREFTPREVARLMGAPETFQVPDTIGQAMTGFGDGVAVPVVRHLVRHIIEPLVGPAPAQRRVAPRRDAVDWRRPIKSKTVGLVTYLPPDAHARLKTLAQAEGISMAQLALDALDLLVACRGVQRLERVGHAAAGIGQPVRGAGRQVRLGPLRLSSNPAAQACPPVPHGRRRRSEPALAWQGLHQPALWSSVVSVDSQGGGRGRVRSGRARHRVGACPNGYPLVAHSIAGLSDVWLLRGRLAFGAGGHKAPFPSAITAWGASDELRQRMSAALPGAWFVPASTTMQPR